MLSDLLAYTVRILPGLGLVTLCYLLTRPCAIRWPGSWSSSSASSSSGTP